MESTVVVKGTQSCSSNLAAKSEDSPIKIDSISIDLANANEDIDAEKCEHFSIRGYAFEMRNKNWSKCWPFGLDDDLSISEERNCKLPPLLVPKFRWWSCQNCMHETGAGLHVSSNGGAAMWLSDLQQAGKINVESGKSDANACVNADSSDCHNKAAKIANIPTIGQTDILQNNISKETHISGYAGIDVIYSLMEQTLHIDNKAASPQLDKPGIKNNGIAGDDVHESNPICAVKDATETHQTTKRASNTDQHMESVKSRGPFGVANMVNEVPDGTKICADEHPSLELDDCDYASSESAGRLLGSTPGSLHRKKTRKVRLLTELLGKNGDEKTDLTSTEDSPSTAIPDASVGIDSISTPNGQASFQENVTNSLALSKKRKLPQDEEWKLGEMSSPNNENTNLRIFNRDAETTDGIAISDSDGTVNGSVSQTGAKSHLVSLKVDKSPTIGKKKNKKNPNFYACLPLSLSREKPQKERQKKPGDNTNSNATDIVLYKSNDVSKDIELNPFSKSAQKAETKSNLLKKKSKMHQDYDGHAFPIPWNNGLFREGPTSRKDVEIRENVPVSVPPKVARGASANRGMQSSHNNFLPSKRCDGKYITSIRDGLPSLLPWQGHVPNEYEIGKKDLKMNYVGDSSFPSKQPELDAYFWKGLHVDPNSNRSTYRISFPSENQKHSSCAEVGSCSLIQQMEFSGICNNGKSMELQDYSAVARKNNDQRAEMASGQGTLDGVPMEVVELMAKNQYESYLPDGEIGKHLSETTNSARNHQIRMDLNKAYGIEEMNLFHETTQKPNPRATNGRIGKIVRGDKQKSVDFFSHVDRNQYNMSQLEQSYCCAGFKPLPLGREKPMNGVQFSATNSSRQNTTPNWQWIGNMVGQRSLQALGVCNTCQSAPQQNKEAGSVQALGVCRSCQGALQQNKETAHLCPSTIPNNSPYLFGIPLKCRDQVANVDLLSNFPSNLPKGNLSGNDDLNFLNQASTFEKHSRKFDSDVLRRTQADYPFACKHNGMGSIDLYSNETIPAMHLLSLMDAGLQSGAPVDVDDNQRSVKKTSSLHGHHSKEFSSLPPRGSRSNSMKHPTYDCYGKSHLPENFCECKSATPAVSPTSFQHDRSFKKTTDFTGQLSLKSREKEKKKCSDSQRQNRNCRSQKNVSSSSNLNKTRGTCTVHSMPKLVLGTSDFMMLPIQHHAIESATKQEEARTTSDSLFRPKTGSENEICYINRNPADFTVPGAGNMYMIRGEDLKSGRGTPLSRMVKSVGRKRQKKLTARKEQS